MNAIESDQTAKIKALTKTVRELRKKLRVFCCQKPLPEDEMSRACERAARLAARMR